MGLAQHFGEETLDETPKPIGWGRRKTPWPMRKSIPSLLLVDGRKKSQGQPPWMYRTL